MRRTSLGLAAVSALALALAPGLADARAGGGGSFGSRGSMTWSSPPTTKTAPYAAAPMQRSMTPNSPSPGYGGFGAPGYAPRSGFMSGLMGGLIGAGLGGLLLGHGFFGGMMGFGGFLGFLLQIFLIVLLVRFLIGLFRRSSPALAGGPNIFARNGAPPMGGGFARPSGPPPVADRSAGLSGVRAVAAGNPERLEPARPQRAARVGDAGDAQLLLGAVGRAGQPRRAQRGDECAPAARRPVTGVERGQPRICLGGDAVLDG